MAEKPIRVFYSEWSGKFYAANRYREKGGVVTITGKKWDVTQDIARAVVEQEIEFKPVKDSEEGR